MLYKTHGIVLNYIKYKETSIIVKIYTESFGLTSYIVNGVRSKKARHKVAFFQPLTLLDMVVYHKKNTQLKPGIGTKMPGTFNGFTNRYQKVKRRNFYHRNSHQIFKGGRRKPGHYFISFINPY